MTRSRDYSKLGVAVGARPTGSDYWKIASYADEVAALAAALDGDKLVYARDTFVRTQPLIVPAKSLTFILEGARFEMAANVSAIRARSGITGLFDLSADYVIGSNVLDITVPTGVLSDYFTIGKAIKIVCDGRDPCNRNEGTRPAAYRTAEWAIIYGIDDGADQLILASPLRYVMSMDGQLTPPDPENLTEVESYTTANNARVFMPVDKTLTIIGGEIEYQAGHDGSWNATAVDIQGWQGVHVDGLHIKKGYSQGVSSATYGGVYNNLVIENLSDFDVTGFSGNIGYGFNENGWYSSVTNMRGANVRHLTDNGGSPVVINETSEGLLFGWGRQVGTVFTNCVGGGQKNAVFDTHQGADDFSFVDCAANGCESYGFTARGRNIQIIRPRINAERGIFVFSEFQDGGAPDEPGLNGKDRPNMSSAHIESPTINCAREAISTNAGYVTVSGAVNITVGAHDAFRALIGGLIDFSSGTQAVKITGTAEATDYNGVFQTSLSTSVFGITGFQGFRWSRGSRMVLDAADATDATAMQLFKGVSGTGFDVQGGLIATLNNDFDAISSGVAPTIDRYAEYTISGTTATREARSYFNTSPSGSVSGDGFIQSLGDDTVVYIDLPVESGIFKVNLNIGLPIGSSEARAAVIAFSTPTVGTERSSLTSGDTTYYEVVDNNDFTTPGTDGKLNISYKDPGTTPGFGRMYFNNRLGATIASVNWVLEAGYVAE